MLKFKIVSFLLQAEKFWQRNPGLFYGSIFFFGFLFALQTPWALLFFALLIRKKLFFHSAILFLLPSCIIYNFYTFPLSGSDVEGIFYIHSIKKNERFGSGWSYKGILKTRNGRIACSCFSKCYFPPTMAYNIQGSVRTMDGKNYTLKIKDPWKQVHGRFSLAMWRMKAQDAVKNYIEKHIAQKRAANFLNGMITGQLEDRIMLREFNQLGLSHLMAISGLHFSLLALAFHFLFRLFLPYKLESICLMVFLTCYLLFIGNTPSVVRAWITIMVFLIGQLLEKKSSALNALGIALIASLLYNPLSSTSLSFQLSFLATAGILFFYSPCHWLLSLWLPKRALKEITSKHWAWQHGYIFASFFREALALTLAVHLTVFPLLLAVFNSFSINSLVYNLFFPFLASLALLFFLASLLLGPWAHVVNGYYCDWILRITESPPVSFKAFFIEAIPAWLLAMLFLILLLAAIRSKIKKGTNGFRIADDPFFNHF